MSKFTPIFLAIGLLFSSQILAQKAATGTGSVTVLDEEIYDLSGSFFAPVLRITGTELDDCCIISNDGPLGLQVTLNGVDYPLALTQFIYESSFDGLGGNDRFIFRAEEFSASWNFSARGGDGNDFLQNVTSNNFLMSGQRGDDTLSVTEADRAELGRISLQYYSDLLATNPFLTILYGGPGNDTFYGGSGGVRMYGSDGDDVFNAGGGDDEVYGGNGDDTILAGPGNDRVFGGAGSDMINGGPGDDLLDSGHYDSYRAYDNQRVVTGDAAGVVIAGSGDDFIRTGPLVDTVFAGVGENVLDSLSVADTVSGSPSTSEDIALIDAPIGAGLVSFAQSYIGGLTMNDISIVGTPFRDFCIVDDNGILLNGVRYELFGDFIEFKGFEGDDTFIFRQDRPSIFGHASGGIGDDFLSAKFADITLEGNDGDDILHDQFGTGSTGGAGDDVFYLRGATRRTFAQGNEGNDTFYGGDNGNYIVAGAGDDLIHGGAAVDTIFGGSGADFITAGEGDDIIDSGIRFGHTVAQPDGGDTVLGGGGNDSIKTGFGDDLVIGGEGDDEIESGPGDDDVRGNEGNDTISLGNGNDIGSGGDGDDVISGNAGDDTITGGSGTNTLTGGPGTNTIN